MEILNFKEISSTQSYAKELVKSGKRGFTVASDSQTDGRGRKGRTWDSPVGGLWFSIVEEAIPAEFFDLITLTVGVAVRAACKQFYDCDIKLKWVNDIFIEDKKVGGIICEEFQSTVIIGVGLNTNVKEISYENAISFLNVTDKKVENEELLIEILEKIREKLELLRTDKKAIIFEFRENMAFIGETRYISSLGEYDKILGINEEGHLLLESGREVFVGEVL